MKANPITKEEIAELKTLYEYRDGELWYLRTWGKTIAGAAVKYISRGGYKRINHNKKTYLVHRIIFLLVNGEWPDTVDHIDGNKLNNHISNLRAATITQNNCNRAINKNSSSGIKGVCWHKGAKKWRVQIRVDGIKKALGLFSSIEEAKSCIEKARQQYHGDYASDGYR